MTLHGASKKNLKMKVLWWLILFAILILACQDSQFRSDVSREHQVLQKAQQFFATFSDRSDWDAFCSFYRTDLEFHDIILQLSLDSLWKFKRFYKWDEEGERFRKLSPGQDHLSVESLVVNDSMVVARGHLNPFFYDDELINTRLGHGIYHLVIFRPKPSNFKAD